MKERGNRTKNHGATPLAVDPVFRLDTPFEFLLPIFLGLLVALTLFLPGEQVERGGVFHLPAILWLLAAVLVVFANREKPQWQFSRLDGIAYAFFGWVVLSQLWNLLPGHGGAPRSTLNMLSAWIGMAAAWFVFRQVLRDRRWVETVLMLVLVVMATEALTGLFQYFVTIPETRLMLEKAPASALSQIDPSIRPDTPEWTLLVNRLKTAGPMGTYPLTNSLGGLLGVWLLFLLALPLYQNSLKKDDQCETKNRTLIPAFGLLFFALVLGTCFLLTRCRSAFVAVAFGMLLIALDQCRRRFGSTLKNRLVPLVAAGVVLTAGLAVLLAAASGKSLLDGARRSLGFRLEYWSASMDMIRDYPVFGCGSGNFKQSYMRYKLPGASEEIADPHHFAVELAAVAGMPALLLFLVLFAMIFWRQRRFIAPEPVEDGDERAPNGLRAKIFAGGFIGGSLAFYLSLYGEAAIDFEAVLFSLPVSVIAFALLNFYGKPFQIPSVLLAVTLLTFFVHLSAAGGVSVTSTAICLWLLGAILLNRSEKESSTRMPSGRQIFYVLFFAGIAIPVIYTTGFRPVMRSQGPESQAQTTSDLRQRLFLLRRARDADPWSAAIQLRLASETFGQWTQHPSDAHLRMETLAAQRRAVRLNPCASGYRFIFAEQLFGMAERTNDENLRETALEYYREAVELYPTQAKFRAPLAWALWKSGQDAEARKQRTEALRLDELTPHSDQKLPPPWKDILTDESRWRR